MVLAALADAEKSNATVSAILTFKVFDRSSVKEEITSLVQTVASEVHEDVEQLDVFPHIAAIRIRAHPPLIRALLARPELERANSGLTQAPFSFGARPKRAAEGGMS
jgi:hypothetical protein